MPRKAFRVDLLFVCWRVEPSFGPFAKVLHHRPIVMEHYSRSPTTKHLYDTMAKLGLCGGQWALRNKRDKPPDLPAGALKAKRAPIALILAAHVSKKLIETNKWLKPLDIPGAWSTQNLEAGGMLLLDLNALPAQPGMHFLRLLPTPTTAKQADERLRALLGDPTIPILARNEFHEAIMNQSITCTNEERKSAYEIAIEEGIERGVTLGDARGEIRTLRNSILGVLRVRDIAVSNTQRAKLLACDDAATLSDLNLKAVVVESAAVLFSEL